LEKASVVSLNSDLFSPGKGLCVGLFCCYGIGEEDDNEEKWEGLWNI
jgi:hypothetical protein